MLTLYMEGSGRVAGIRLKALLCCAQVQVVALECLPRLPAPKLCRALAGDELGKRVLLCLSNSSKEVGQMHPRLGSYYCPSRRDTCAAALCAETQHVSHHVSCGGPGLQLLQGLWPL